MKQKTLQTQYNLIKEGKGNKEVFLKEAKRIFPNYIPNAATFNQAEVILSQKSIISETVWGVTTGRDEKPDWFAIFNDNMKTINEEVKVGDILTKDGKEGKVVKVMGDMVNVDFGNGDVYGITHSRIKDGEILAEGEILNEEAKAVEKKTSKEVEDLQAPKKGYDYKDDKLLNNVAGEQFRQGYYTELTDEANADKTKQELIDLVIKNLDKNPSYYVEEAQFGVKGIGYTKDVPGLGKGKMVKDAGKGGGYGEATKKDFPEGEV
jgi:hypothetical protein